MTKYVISVLSGLALLAGCGGGGGGSPSSPSDGIAQATNLAFRPDSNVLPVTVNVGPTFRVNQLFASVTVCSPGSSSNCETIDRILVDSGSTGLRILASALSAVALPQQADVNGSPVAECAQFAEGVTWGPVKIADVRIAGEQAISLPIQVIGDPAFSSIPAPCASTGPLMSTVETLGANGFLGIGVFRRDCGIACAQSGSPGIYYVCPASGCLPTARRLAEQVTNPVSMFAENNNGVIVQLPAIPATGAASVEGSLVFGIGTRTNNALGSALVFTQNTLTGGIATAYNGSIFGNSYFDTGSNAFFFTDARFPTCSGIALSAGFDCPVSTQNLSATIQGSNGTNTSVNFSVANADALLAGGFGAFSSLAAPITWTSPNLPNFIWGLPFFFGRKVFVAIEDADVLGAPAGPFVAF